MQQWEYIEPFEKVVMYSRFGCEPIKIDKRFESITYIKQVNNTHKDLIILNIWIRLYFIWRFPL